MNNFSVSIGKRPKGTGRYGMPRIDPATLRNVHAAILFVIEAAVTGDMPKPLVQVVGGTMDNITLQPIDLYIAAQRATSVRCELFFGLFGGTYLGAHMYFMDCNRIRFINIDVAANPHGIRYIREVYRVVHIHRA